MRKNVSKFQDNRSSGYCERSKKRMGRMGNYSPWPNQKKKLLQFWSKWAVMLIQFAGKYLKFNPEVWKDLVEWLLRTTQKTHGEMMGNYSPSKNTKNSIIWHDDVIKTCLNFNTICGHMWGRMYQSFRTIGRVVIENEAKNAWGIDGELFPIAWGEKWTSAILIGMSPNFDTIFGHLLVV